MNIFSPICSFLKAAWIRVTSYDGSAGLQASDFDLLVKCVISYSSASMTNDQKRNAVTGWAQNMFVDKINTSSWIYHLLVWIAYTYSKRKGLLKS